MVLGIKGSLFQFVTWNADGPVVPPPTIMAGVLQFKNYRLRYERVGTGRCDIIQTLRSFRKTHRGKPIYSLLSTFNSYKSQIIISSVPAANPPLTHKRRHPMIHQASNSSQSLETFPLAQIILGFVLEVTLIVCHFLKKVVRKKNKGLRYRTD